MKRLQWSRRAKLKINEIWGWNATEYGIDRANRYTNDLLHWIEDLANDPNSGYLVADDPVLRYTAFRKSRNSHGHVVVFRIDEDAIRITDLFHTAQDWRTKLEEL